MIFKCREFANKEFASKEEMFLALKANEAKIIGLKKAQIYNSDEHNRKEQISCLNLDVSKLTGAQKNFTVEDGYIYPVISTTLFMDSHKDVHFNGCFTKTIKEQQGKVYYALDHELKWNSILAWEKDVEMFSAMIDWQLVGKSYAGQTEALIFKIAKDKITKADVLQAIVNKVSDFENSIRMVYYKINLAVNSAAKELKENKAYFDSRIDEIANKDEVLEDGYFWGVEELGIHKEGSLVVAGGSNSATGIIVENIDPFEYSQKQVTTDPPQSSQKINLIHLLT